MQKHYLLLAIAVLASLVVSATSAGFGFYKLSLVWPTSTCNTATCRDDNIPGYFTIHGLWPEFDHDTPVPPYDKANPCTLEKPLEADQIMVHLESIKNELKRMWPNLLSKDDSELWKHEWTKHGMCSDYPTEPKDYFNAALTLAKMIDPLGMGIGFGKTKVEEILRKVHGTWGVYPEILCNTAKGPSLQLQEIRFCYDRAKPPSELRDCPTKVRGTCKKEDVIDIPAPVHVLQS
ncbi:Ribonuclease T2-like protein [Corchorus capsularis]|uniref:Ribonuclease T2-like protein n=1 Tax=Corchorus capsularis TaxID=210143 RepID=A0A1R3FWT2_COCAP|nr:Ribonuclease T2-like protein [Corchorus capsularis]